MLFDDWFDIARAVAAGGLSYIALVAMVRVAGKRTLAKLNAFDLVITVAFGSTLATIILSSEVSLAEGGAALALLVLLQFLVAWSGVRAPAIRRLVKSDATFLVRDGRILHAALRHERITVGEISQAIRASGSGGLEPIAAVVLEPDGTLSVITAADLGTGSALNDVTVFGES